MKVSCTNCNNELLVEDPADSNFCFCRSCDRHFDGSIIESLRQSGDSPASGSDTVEDGGTLEFHPAADSGRSELEPGEATETRERPLRTLGNFTILDHLGAGQLGKVYRARNTRLEREVAFKVPKEFV
ncbi:MAG: hypothetical protein VX768_03070, partial [Planctomycetota bacterium]|nr:hypothetical protein [Planctomycetota bacterium]